jgi:hydrogenase-4 component E
MMENSIFLLSLSISQEMPMIVNLGVLLDVFIAVFILGFLVKEAGRTLEISDDQALRNLKDSEDVD